MKKFLFATMGSLGDLHPYISVAMALQARGHKAAIASSEEYRKPVESAGIEFSCIRPNIADFGDYQEVLSKVYDVRRGSEYLIRELIMPNLHKAYEDFMQASKGADLLVSHPLTFTVPLAAQMRNIPWVSTVLSPFSIMSVYDPPVNASAIWMQKLKIFGSAPYRMIFSLLKKVVYTWEKPLRDFRSELGLPLSKETALFEGQFSKLRNLALFDPQLAKIQPDWPVNTKICGTPLFDGNHKDENLTAELKEFLSPENPPIVFALGSSAVWVAEDFWDKAAWAANAIGRRALLITGPAVPRNLPEGIKAYPYLPFSKVFPRALAVVHQSGIGTLAQAMRSGRPQLMVPFTLDQPDNSLRAKNLGLGRILPSVNVTKERLAKELSILLQNQSYEYSADRVSSELKGVDGALVAADELIKLVS